MDICAAAATNIWLDERDVAHLGDFDSAVMENSDPAKLPITTNTFASPEELRGDCRAAAGGRVVVADMAVTEFCDSSGIGALAAAWKEAQAWRL